MAKTEMDEKDKNRARFVKKNYFRILGIIIFMFILYKINPLKILPVIKNTYWTPFGFAMALLFPLMSLKAMRWNSLLKMQNIQYSLKGAISVYLASYYVGMVTPGRVGDFIKVGYLSRDKAVSYGGAFVSVIVDRFLDLILIIVVGMLGICFFDLFEQFGYFSFGFLALLAFLFWGLFNNEILNKILGFVCRIFLKKYRYVAQLHFNDFIADMNKLKNIKLFLPVLLTILAYGITFLQCYLIALALRLDVSFFYVAFTVSITGLVTLLPVSFAGIGTRDAAVIFLFGLTGIGPQEAVGFSLLYLAVFVFVIGLWGAVYWFRKPLKVRE